MSRDKLNCLIVDDENIAIKGLSSYIEHVDFLEIRATCSSAVEASDALKENEIDLMFLDINMPLISGMEFLTQLKKVPLTIITTAYSEHALECFRFQVVDYLLKPFLFERFFQAVTKAKELYEQHKLALKNNANNSYYLYVRQGDMYVKLNMNEIIYIESMQNYVKIQSRDNSYIVHQTMNCLEETLPNNLFFRIHRSYIINLKYITAISFANVSLGQIELPLSKNKRETLLNNEVYSNLISK